MFSQCETTQQTPQAAISMRTRTAIQDLPQVLGKSYGALFTYLGVAGEKPAGTPFVAYHNMDMQNLDIEVGVPVSIKLAGNSDIKASQIPGGKAATCTYTGPYNAIEAAYTALQQFIKDHQYRATGVCYEFYLNDPATTPPENLQTKIVFPLKGK